MNQDRKRAVFEDDREDRISGLPSNIIDRILGLLPAQDAARTSSLSKKWRYIWGMLPNLVLDKLFCEKIAARSESIFKETVDKILLQHLGDIVKFYLDVSGVQLSPCPDIDRWILYATRNGVKELTLNVSNNSTYKLPSYIFNCPTLTHLILFNCVFKPPNSFLGFQNLRTLCLEKITFVPTTEFCVIKAPLVYNLTLIDCSGTQYLDIVVSSELKYLFVRESHCNLDLNGNCFKNCKNLRYLYLWVDNPMPSERLTFEKLLFSSPTLEILSLGSFALEQLRAGAVPKGLPFTLNFLWHLKLGVNFNKLGQTCCTLELIKSSPNLSKLEIWDNAASDPTEAVMKDSPACLDRTLNKLEDVTIHSYKHSKAVLSFVKLLFAHAPSLLRMTVKPAKASGSKEGLNTATELMRFPRVSPKAELFYHLKRSWIKAE